MLENNKVIIKLHMVDQGPRKSAGVEANTLIVDKKLQKTWLLVKLGKPVSLGTTTLWIEFC